MDKTTTISYIKSSKENVLELDGTKVCYSNKVWRQIISFSKEMNYFIQSRQYPNTSSANSRSVAELASKIIKGDNIEVKDVVVNGFLSDIHCSNPDYEDLFYNDIEYRAFDIASVGVNVDELGNVEEFLSKDNVSTLVETNNICAVGADVECICGCGSSLTHGGYLCYETYQENECYDDYEDYEDYED